MSQYFFKPPDFGEFSVSSKVILFLASFCFVFIALIAPCSDLRKYQRTPIISDIVGVKTSEARIFLVFIRLVKLTRLFLTSYKNRVSQ